VEVDVVTLVDVVVGPLVEVEEDDVLDVVDTTVVVAPPPR
jgi:hypothetical protein